MWNKWTADDYEFNREPVNSALMRSRDKYAQSAELWRNNVIEIAIRLNRGESPTEVLAVIRTMLEKGEQ